MHCPHQEVTEYDIVQSKPWSINANLYLYVSLVLFKHDNLILITETNID